jgi:1-deoxy-D-xylulose-5-phosphate synthase
MEITPGSLLKSINFPVDLKKLSKDQLHQVCDELRQYIIDVVSVYGGHFGASLGVVELTVALHFYQRLQKYKCNLYCKWLTGC